MVQIRCKRGQCAQMSWGFVSVATQHAWRPCCLPPVSYSLRALSSQPFWA
ncbi:hypothetical protein LINGRAPRIM_LOCUS116 [Linum grandiflorum]